MPLQPCHLPLAAARFSSIFLLAVGCVLLLRMLLPRGAVAHARPALVAVGSLRARPWKSADAAFLFLVLLLPAVPALLAFRTTAPVSAPAPTAWQLVPSCLFYAAILAGVWAAGRRTGLGASAALGVTRKNARAAAGAGLRLGLAMLPPVLLVAWFSGALLQWLGIPAARQNVFDTLADPGLGASFKLLLVLLAVTVVPVAEEAIFRGVLLPVVLRGRGLTGALLLVNLVFALLHLHLPSFLPLLAVGACLSLGMAATGSLLTPIVMHALFNGEMLLLFYAWPELAG